MRFTLFNKRGVPIGCDCLFLVVLAMMVGWGQRIKNESV